jgi:RNA polymerase sigma-70 factor, ECF subfamily
MQPAGRHIVHDVTAPASAQGSPVDGGGLSTSAGVDQPRGLGTGWGEEAAELIRRMAEGHRAPLERLYSLYAGIVYSLAIRMLRNSADAEEVVQEVFVQVWRDAPRYDPGRGTPHAWLMTIARARAIDALRSARRREQPVELSRYSEAAEAGSGNSDWIAERHLVTTALGQISPAQREMLELAYFQGLTQTEIAARTRLPLGTVKTRIRTGMERLRDSLVPKVAGRL